MQDKPQAPIDKAKVATEIYPSATAPPTNRELSPQELLWQEIDLVKNYRASSENMFYLYGALFSFFVLGPLFSMINRFFNMVFIVVSLYFLTQALSEAKRFELKTGKKSKAKTAIYIMIALVSLMYLIGFLGTAISQLIIVQNQY